ncbi:sulfur carrier protein ThiS [Kurthia huakuii]|uniref:sulfur carrier protein ThiS n=1 Tax=Kurthia huakuii TaxID=1421019 RepID=UPI0004952A40|nr:sulfur carrier protein ThiS [Kurthia huakuii]MBM7698798.1 sulfur carrier protein [Kurthia huakuii]
MTITVNGHNMDIPLSCNTIAQLLAHLKLKETLAIVEQNGHILSKKTYATQQLHQQDTIEIVQFVGGG